MVSQTDILIQTFNENIILVVIVAVILLIVIISAFIYILLNLKN